MKEESLPLDAYHSVGLLICWSCKIVSVDILKGSYIGCVTVHDKKHVKREGVCCVSQLEFEQQEYEGAGCLAFTARK